MEKQAFITNVAVTIKSETDYGVWLGEINFTGHNADETVGVVQRIPFYATEVHILIGPNVYNWPESTQGDVAKSVALLAITELFPKL